jgi:TM2 domain-containing membrane protein YozV
MKNKKIPLLALVLSFFVPGLGQIYNENYLKGGVMIALCMVAVVLDITIIGLIIGIPLMVGVWIWAMVNAHKTASATTVEAPAAIV